MAIFIFFTNITQAMEIEKIERKGINPPSLKFLAAVKVPNNANKKKLPQELIEYHKTIENIIKNPTKALCKTFKEKKYDISAYLITHGADINEKESGEIIIKSTTIDLAAMHGNSALVKLLQNNGAKIYREGHRKTSGFFSMWEPATLVPLDYAIFNRNKETAYYLIQELTKIEKQEVLTNRSFRANRDFSSLDLASTLEEKDIEKAICEVTGFLQPKLIPLNEVLYYGIAIGAVNCVKELIEKHQIDISTFKVKAWPHNPLSLSARYNQIEMMNFLKENGTDINELEISGDSALHFAALEGNSDATKWLLENGANVDRHDQHKVTPLLEAANYGNNDIIEILLQHGASIEFQDPQGCRPLHRAAQRGNTESIKILLKHGAQINPWDNSYLTPLWYAENNRHPETADFLRNYNSSWTSYCQIV
jgi:ankyrin repeat protein